MISPSSADQEVPKIGGQGWGAGAQDASSGGRSWHLQRSLGGVPGSHMPKLSYQPCKPSQWEPAPKHSITMVTTYPAGPCDLNAPSLPSRVGETGVPPSGSLGIRDLQPTPEGSQPRRACQNPMGQEEEAKE